jgi:hypothetical protein
MFKTLRDAVTSILNGRGLSIANKQSRTGGFGSMYDREMAANHKHLASDPLRNAILGLGEKRPVPTAANIMQCPMREIGARKQQQQSGGANEMNQYLKNGGIFKDD